MACSGNGPDHCCWVNGQVCPALRDDGPGAERRWVCTLYEAAGDWAAVHASPEWRALPVAAWFEEQYPGHGCGDWPQGIAAVVGGRCCWETEVAVGRVGG